MKLQLLVVSICLALSGCASEMNRAEKFLDNGNYDDAIHSYETVLKYSPSNEDAKIGLLKAREAWISQKLIEVRLLRLAGNVQRAATLLDSIIDKEGVWEVFPRGAATFTQEEETQYAAENSVIEARRALEAGKTLQASFLLHEHRQFFQAKREVGFAQLESFTRKRGQEDCTKLKSKIRPDDYYYGLFTKKYCQYFGGAVPDLKVQSLHEREKLFSDVEVDIAAPQTNEAVKHLVQEVFRKDFKSTPWFDSSGRSKLKMATNIRFDAHHSTAPKKLKHSYSVSIPYQEERVESKPDPKKSEDRSFLSDVGSVLSLLGTVASIGSPNSSHSSTRDNGDGTVTITETKYRSEPRWVEYDATEHLQHFRLDFDSKSNVASEPVLLTYQKSDDHLTIEHDNDMPDVGLRPEKPQLIPENEWLKSQLEIASGQFKEKLVTAWDHKFCSDTLAQSSMQFSPDLVFRCWHARSTHLPVAFQNWFQSTFGVTLDQGEQLLGPVL